MKQLEGVLNGYRIGPGVWGYLRKWHELSHLAECDCATSSGPLLDANERVLRLN